MEIIYLSESMMVWAIIEQVNNGNQFTVVAVMKYGY
jgi:hypothetical protein